MKITHTRYNKQAEVILLQRIYKAMKVGKFSIAERKDILEAWSEGFFDHNLVGIKKSCKSS